MKWLCLIAVIALIMTCTIMRSETYRDWIAQKQDQQDRQFQAAIDMLQDFPTAAGKKK
jgi:hypothetical protein